MENLLPSEFIDQLKKLPFFDLSPYLSSFNQEITSFRINPKKISNRDINFEKITWSEFSYYLESRPEFILDPLWHAGVYYVQEAGSIFLEEVFKQLKLHEKDILALDLAAAPGGKSTHILSLLSQNSLLISNEILPKRAKILEENITRWGYDNQIITNNSSEDFRDFQGEFDLLVLDAPCSGEGMFRKDQNSISEWSLTNVQMCAERQKDILENIKNIISYDGYLIYSTCTFNQEENEFLIEEFAKNNNFELVDIDISKYANLVKNNFTIRAIPGKSNTEGFTITVLQNKNDNPKKNNKSNHKLNKIKNPFPSLFSVDSEFDFIEYKEEVYLFRKAFENILSKYLNKLKIVSFGNKIANSKKSQRNQIFIPNHNISSAININRKNIINLSDSDCLRFLKGESLQLEIDKNNYYFVAYKNYSIGIVKITNGRANNLYPDNFRIKKTVDYNEPIKSFL